MKGQLSFDLITAIIIAGMFLQTLLVIIDSVEDTSEHLSIEAQEFFIAEDIASMLDLAPLLRPNMHYFHELPWLYVGEERLPCTVAVDPIGNTITVSARGVAKQVVFANSEEFTVLQDFSALRCGRKIKIERTIDENVFFTQA